MNYGCPMYGFSLVVSDVKIDEYLSVKFAVDLLFMPEFDDALEGLDEYGKFIPDKNDKEGKTLGDVEFVGLFSHDNDSHLQDSFNQLVKNSVIKSHALKLHAVMISGRPSPAPNPMPEDERYQDFNEKSYDLTYSGQA